MHRILKEEKGYVTGYGSSSYNEMMGYAKCDELTSQFTHVLPQGESDILPNPREHKLGMVHYECMGHKRWVEHSFEWVNSFWRSYAMQPKFMWLHTDTMHVQGPEAEWQEMLDGPLMEHLQQIAKDPRTVILLMGDHGPPGYCEGAGNSRDSPLFSPLFSPSPFPWYDL